MLTGVEISATDAGAVNTILEALLLTPVERDFHGGSYCSVDHDVFVSVRSAKRFSKSAVTSFRLTYDTPAELALVLASVGVHMPEAMTGSARTDGWDVFMVTATTDMIVELATRAEGRDQLLDPDLYLADHLDPGDRELLTRWVLHGGPAPRTRPVLGTASIGVDDPLATATFFCDNFGFKKAGAHPLGLLIGNGQQEIVLHARRARSFVPGGLVFTVPAREHLTALGISATRCELQESGGNPLMVCRLDDLRLVVGVTGRTNSPQRR
jgi:hypothetical protein